MENGGLKMEGGESAGSTDAPSSILYPRSSIPYRTLGTSALFAAYTEGAPDALAFYRHDPWDPAARAEAARLAAEHPRDRDVLADVLHEQQRMWAGGSDRAHDAIDRLRDPASVAVVTGQQLGLFGGPLYTVYKALTAVRLAEQIGAETGRPAVPVFWLAGEDHDYAEVHRTTVLDRYTPIHVAYDDGTPPDANRGPVGRLTLGEGIGSALDTAGYALRQGPAAASIAAALRADWAAGMRWRDAFARTLRRLTGDVPLVFVSSDDPRLKKLAAPIFHREIETWPETFAALEDVSARLDAEGFHAQIAPRPVNLFLFENGQRLALDPDGGGGFTLRSTATRFSKDELLALLDDAPERFSPGVGLRPVVQDALFPTVAYVGGPGETAYFAQLKPVYEWFGVPMPVVYPRASLTFVPPKVRGILDRYGLSVADLAGDREALHRRLALEHLGTDLDGHFAEAAAALDALLDALAPAAVGVDTSLDRAVEAARAKARKALGALEKKTVRAAKRNEGTIRERLDRVAGALFPGGAPQERTLSALSFLADDPDFPRHILHVLDIDTREHQVVERS